MFFCGKHNESLFSTPFIMFSLVADGHKTRKSEKLFAKLFLKVSPGPVFTLNSSSSLVIVAFYLIYSSD